jgi:putative NADPH-quinone reductase
MGRRIALIQGHPDTTSGHYCRALADAYAAGADEGGHEIRCIDVATLDFPLLHSKYEFEQDGPPEAIRSAQESIKWADHIVIIYPLWLGLMPARLKAFLEQVFRPGFAFHIGANAMQRLLKGRSARIVVTMGMPALVYRWYFGAHGLKALRRSVLGFCGFGPIRDTLIGTVESTHLDARLRWLKKLRALGRGSR